MSNGTSVSFGDNAKVDTLATGENAVIDKSQGKTIVHGDLHGGVHNAFDSAPDMDPLQFIAALQNMYHVESARVSVAGPVDGQAMTDDEALEQALDQATANPDSPPRLAAPPVSQTTASEDQVFTDLKQAVAEPNPTPAKAVSYTHLTLPTNREV